MNYCTEVHLNGPYPDPIDRDQLWEGNRYRPMNQGQYCHSSDWENWEVGRIPCKEDAYMMIGGVFMGNHIGFCTKHWLRFLDTLRSELVEARGDRHWLIEHVMQHYGPNIISKAREAAMRAEADERRQLLITRTFRRDSVALADELIGGSRVYFIQSGKTGPIKIGVANDVLKRLDALQTGSPYKLRIRATISGDRGTESTYHRLFAEHRMLGEWFKPAPAIRDEIKAIVRAKRHKPDALF